MSKKTGNPFKVKELHSTDFFDLKALTDETGKNFTINENKEKVVWHDICICRVEKNFPSTIFYKTSYEDKEWKELNVRGKARGRQRVLELELLPAYSELPSISKLKKKDLLDLCEAHVIPRVHWDFFKNIKTEDDIQ